MEDSEQRSGNGQAPLERKPGGARLPEVMEHYKGLVRDVFYSDHSGKREKLPYYDYSAASETEQKQVMRELHEAAVADGNDTNDCNDSADEWAAQVELSEDNNFFCVDSTGAASESTTAIGASATVCP